METVNIAIFILDDDKDLLDIIKETIDRAGIKDYRLFTDEVEFLNGLSEEIHVCVVDHYLKNNTGLNILREIKAKNKYSYVIGYSGMRDFGTMIKYINSHVDGWVDKNDDKHLQQLTDFLKEGVEEAKERIEGYSYIKKKALSTSNP